MTVSRRWTSLPPLALLGVAGLVWSAWAATTEIMQRGRAFLPNTVQIHKGETVTFTNNDGDLLHHAYLTTPQFSFDTGEQVAGGQVQVRFTKEGNFTVLCAIHPKMRLVVTVE